MRTRSALAVLAASLLLAVAACSSSDDGSAGADRSTTSGSERSTTTAASGSTGGEPLARYADYTSKNYDDPAHWVCRPDTPDDVCHGDLDATEIQADGTMQVEKFERAEDPPIDCFYVYPTISNDKGAYSDWTTSPDEEDFVTQQQAARLGSQCRVFAPVYRQGTLTGITSRLTGGEAPEGEGDPYADVADAFKTYMATDNEGRGFVLIGHSQGTFMLQQLIAEEVDPNPDVREKLVGAYLAGGGIAVPEGETVGGAFQHVPLCTEPDEAGCIYTWATFRSTAPPPAGSFFGTVRGGADPGQVAGCVNPGDPTGGSTDADAYFPADASGSILKALGTGDSDRTWVDPSAGTIDTPFVKLPGLVSVQCTAKDGFHYLEATVHPDPGPRADDIAGDLTPEWGLHLVDVNLVMGDIVDAVGRQAKTYAG